MSTGPGQAHESHFGPTSERIDIASFLQSAQTEAGCADPQCSTSIRGNAQEEWSTLSAGTKSAIQLECSVDDLQSSLCDVVVNPRLMAHVTRTHDASVQSIHETADTSNRRKRKRVTLVAPDHELPEVLALRQKLEDVQLKSWPLLLNAALFIRTPRNPDFNTLLAIKRLTFFRGLPIDEPQALIFITIYTRLLWGHRLVVRSSQHVLLSSQTLEDLVNTIPCISNDIPSQHMDEQGITTWRQRSSANKPGCVIGIEDALYRDEQSDVDYSDKILQYIRAAPNESRPTLTRGPSVYDIPFKMLKLRLHQPYWMIHRGDCEHFFVVEQIRLHHPSDPPITDYPLTTQITPPLLDVCRACNKVPAVYSILGDIRLGESPFMICDPCWRWMGIPPGSDAEEVTVVPLPVYKSGW